MEKTLKVKKKKTLKEKIKRTNIKVNQLLVSVITQREREREKDKEGGREERTQLTMKNGNYFKCVSV